MTEPSVALVVPSLGGVPAELLASVERQTLRPIEVEVVEGVRPSGRARNLGARRTSAELLVFVDDDAVLGGDETLARLVAPLVVDPTIGAAGASKLVPPESSRFQRLVARQVPRIEHPVARTELETVPHRGYVELTTTCCALRRTVFEQAGGFDERLERGVDSEFFLRLVGLGYRLVLAPRTWVYHPAPASLRALLNKHFLYGVGFAQEVRLEPSRAGRRLLRTPAHAAGYVLLRTLALVPHTLLPYTHASPSLRPGFKPLRALTSYAAALGYVYGWYRRPPLTGEPRR